MQGRSRVVPPNLINDVSPRNGVSVVLCARLNVCTPNESLRRRTESASSLGLLFLRGEICFPLTKILHVAVLRLINSVSCKKLCRSAKPDKYPHETVFQPFHVQNLMPAPVGNDSVLFRLPPHPSSPFVRRRTSCLINRRLFGPCLKRGFLSRQSSPSGYP